MHNLKNRNKFYVEGHWLQIKMKLPSCFLNELRWNLKIKHKELTIYDYLIMFLVQKMQIKICFLLKVKMNNLKDKFQEILINEMIYLIL